MKKREIKKTAAFLLCICLIFLYINTVFSFPAGEARDGAREKWNTFYSMKDNTLDAIYLGNSAVDRFWVSPLAWKQTGAAVYPFAISSLSPVFLRSMMEECLKTQDVKLFIIDIRTFTSDADNLSDSRMRRVVDNMKWSETKLEAMEEGFRYAAHGTNDVDSSDPSWYFPFLKYHIRWTTDLKFRELFDLYPTTDYGGYAAYQPKVFTSVPQGESYVSSSCMPLEQESRLQLDRLLDYCGTLDCEILFVDAPYCMTKEQREKSNTVAELVRSAGFPFLEFNSDKMYDKLELDLDCDFYDARHVNFMGAVKYTRYLSQYLEREYDLEEYENHHDPAYWESAYEKLSHEVAQSSGGLISANRRK